MPVFRKPNLFFHTLAWIAGVILSQSSAGILLGEDAVPFGRVPTGNLADGIFLSRFGI
jgi:hypothetical protein